MKPSTYAEQISSIRDKLQAVRKLDTGLQVFGADSHDYVLHPPCSLQHVESFERDHGISLPEAYRRFITEVGHAGTGYLGSGAGPFYGLYALGDGQSDIGSENIASTLQNPCLLHPAMGAEEWANLAADLLHDESDADEEDDDAAEAAFLAALERVYGGLLLLGTQGCNYYHALILNGEYRGRIVNLSMEFEQPVFCYEADFLCWYERWLDEILSGDLLAETVGWFAYQKGGSASQLFAEFQSAPDYAQAKACLLGIQNKRQLDNALLLSLQAAFYRYPAHQRQLAQILCKSDYALAHAPLTQLYQQDVLGFLQCLHWYAKDQARHWREPILQALKTSQDIETLRFSGYLCDSFKDELVSEYSAAVLTHLHHPDAEFRQQAIYQLAALSDKSALLSHFAQALFDPALAVQRQTLHAIQGWPATEFLPGLRHIANTYPQEQDYILSSLKQVLAGYGMSLSELL